MLILVVNAGSSSLKLRLLGEHDEIVESSHLEPDGDLGAVLRRWPRPDAVGHRVVHGGVEFTSAVRVDDRVRRRLDELTDLAPLHQPKSLAALDAVSAALPDAPAPRWHVTTREPPASSEARRDAYACDSPWKP